MIERKIYQDGLLVVTRCSGDLTGDELIRSAHWMIDNYGDVIKPGFCQIFDALDANSEAVTEDDIHRVAHINLNHGHDRLGFSMAILAVKPYPVALAKLHKLLSVAADINVEIFSDIELAYEWLVLNNQCPELQLPDKEAVGY
ncbi:MAG TPA: hypothetical protein ENJ87_11315 [Gammaproteobacteria bacterium]|nr:hypothetical protein [Gammaproteobacteria bacterium]